jgi:hypothetical protein
LELHLPQIPPAAEVKGFYYRQAKGLELLIEINTNLMFLPDPKKIPASTRRGYLVVIEELATIS